MFFPLIKADELIHLHRTGKLILIDARFHFPAYLEAHLEGAIHVDLNKDLSQIDENPANGGRHPLPSPKAFAELLGRLGISPDSHVVVYDDKQGAMSAARFWWMLKALGHEKIQVLDGGLQAAQKQGFPLERTFPPSHAVPAYPTSHWQSPISSFHEVKTVYKTKEKIIIDVRESERFRGIVEPIDKIAGHIPGAVNLPYLDNLDEKGLFLPQDKLKEKYLKTFQGQASENIIVHCGSGVTACHSLLAICIAGLDMANLYVGSWSEWSRNNLPISTEK
ncbi:sulfurtransferase [Cyclobacterium marinum]|uniref:sulfurtransferase n=1 Tax=Cyclobacterium marinum TaxID=104 RepID=UPI0011EE6151|nr:sulfurtransferase [Cyclobacterium marinum]MBI0400242.1 sulfurtransferase [Cyclobacterium marinum]